MTSNYEKVMKRVDAAKSKKSLWEQHLRECYRYAMPQRNTIDKWSKGAKKREYVFDSTAEDSLEDFATRMELELVPPNMNWMKLEVGSDMPEEKVDKNNEYLEETTEILFNHIKSSNFSSQIHEAFLDLGISTGAVIVEAGDGIQSSLNFRAVSLSEVILEQTSQGIVDTVFREFVVQAADIPETWPTAKLNEKLKQLIADKPTTEVELLEGVYAHDKGYQTILIHKEERDFLIDEQIESNPWVIFRESTIPGETMGRGRVMRALPDIKTLNLMVKQYLTSLEWWAHPTFTATDDGIINPATFSLRPGTVNPVGSNANDNPTLRPLVPAGKPEILIDGIGKLQDNIRRILISKPFGNVEDTPVRTATEMSIRNADLAKSSLGASGRIQNELLERLVARCVFVLKQAGKIAEFKVDGKEVAIKFTSPSSRSQDESQLAAIGRFMEMMQILPPELVNEEIRVEDFPAEVMDILGLPARFKRSDEEKQMRQQQAQQQAQQQQEMAAEQVAAQEGQ